ncbi:hypothetical protein V3I01_09175 [Sphingomonas sp. gentR]|jgi:hypothetical protein|uniref:hypothetical protein n=1 Tax=unclassified Sphingomonas TaxID=196159 RepID=UPI0009728719|nr:hypothetical protein [Sphingomonas sp. LK11]APX66444.1 hypothetical protein AV944_12075 [Sphingomonas sp. LK11]
MIRWGRAVSPSAVKAVGLLPAVMLGIELPACDWGHLRDLYAGQGNPSPMFQYAAMARFIEDEWIAGDKKP